MKDALARKRLSDERERLEKVLEGLRDEQAEGAGPELSVVDQHPADAGTDTFERDKDISIVVNVEAELNDVDRAIRRVENGTYGSCEACGRPIGAARLEARPMARFCVDDQVQVERHARSA
jgi:DnaK suppressor protein